MLYACMHTCVKRCAHIYSCTHMLLCMYTNTSMCTYLHIQAINACTHMSVHTHPCKYMHAHTSIYTYTYIHTCIFMYVHMHACTFTFMYTYTHAHTRPFHACLIPYLNLWTVFYFWCYESSFLCPTFHPRNELSSCEVHLTTCGFLLSNKTY